jgi:hypothetical protein
MTVRSLSQTILGFQANENRGKSPRARICYNSAIGSPFQATSNL